MLSIGPTSRFSPLARALVGGAVVAALALGGAALPAVQAHDAPGAVYSETNQPAGNQIVIFNRAADGSLSAAGTIATGGLGAAAGLGSQGAVVLSQDHRYLFAVNAGSNSISSFAVVPGGLSPLGATPTASAGIEPVSLSLHNDLLYVVNSGDATHAANIHGFRVNSGRLRSIPNSDQALSAANPMPAEIAFRPDGRVLVVSEKGTNAIDTFVVDDDGRADPAAIHTFSPSTPFGFAFSGRNTAIVSDAGSNAASSYAVARDGDVAVETALAGNGDQTAPCWIATTSDGRFAYSANAHTDTISGFRVGADGQISLLGAHGVTVSGQGPTDLAISPSDQVLYAVTNGSQSISVFAIDHNGRLSAQNGPSALAFGLTGLAVR